MLAVGLRLSLPDGWMLDPGRGLGSALVLCPDAGPLPAAQPAQQGSEHAAHGASRSPGHASAPHGHDERGASHGEAGSTAVCPFAGAAVAVALDPPQTFSQPLRLAVPTASLAGPQTVPDAAAGRRPFQARAPPEIRRA